MHFKVKLTSLFILKFFKSFKIKFVIKLILKLLSSRGAISSLIKL